MLTLQKSASFCLAFPMFVQHVFVVFLRGSCFIKMHYALFGFMQMADAINRLDSIVYVMYL